MKEPYGVLKVTGPDAKKLLQGQVTCDVEKIAAGQHCLAAHCNPQGRVISLFQLVMLDDGYYLVMLQSMVPIALNAFKKYAVFYKVNLEGGFHDNSYCHEVPPFEKGGLGGIFLRGIFPNIHPQTTGKFLPHELNLDQLGAISFDKGCYTGQEIIARLHYRGKLKTRLYPATLESSTPPQPGADIFCQQNNQPTACGTLVDAREKAYNFYEVLVLTDETNAKKGRLFLKDGCQLSLA